jgi:hypothetical protein
LDQANIPYTLHWGQQLREGPDWVRRAYGPALPAWLEQRHAWLPTASARRLFSNDVLDQLGLTA